MNQLIDSAINGDAKAQYHLGVLYQDGRGVEKDYVQAASWYRKAAEQGHPKAQLYLGLLYFKGYGVPQNRDEAIRLLTLSSDPKAHTFLEEIQSIPEHEEIRSYSRPLVMITAGICALFLAVIAYSGYIFMKADSVIETLPVATLPTNDDDIFSPPVNSMFNPDVFALAENGTISQIQDAIIRGISFREVHSDGETPLHRAAAKNQDPEVLRLLIARGLDTNSEWAHETGYTPLLLAITNGNVNAALELLNKGANPNYIDGNSHSILQHLILSGNDGTISQNDLTRIMIAMLKNGADMNYHSSLALSSSSCTPLSLAVQHDMPEAAELLIDSNADLNITDASGKTASDYARSLSRNSALRKSPVFARLTAASEEQVRTTNRNIASGKTQVEKLLKAKKVSPFVRDTGTFEYDARYDGGIVEIDGTSVRMRAQPNTKSKILKTTSGMNLSEAPKYLGEWTNPKGERWVVCEYTEGKAKRVAWIFGRYTHLVTAQEVEAMLYAEAEAESLE